jgi:hypothetical protein
MTRPSATAREECLAKARLVDDDVTLARLFQPVAKDLEKHEQEEIRQLRGLSAAQPWLELETGWRTVILADAGAGKTFEMQRRATALRETGKDAFFLRIENLVDGIESALEIGTPEALSDWLEGEAEGWFFLDSVDEARLESPVAFEKALRAFASRLGPSLHRAHVLVSSRPYAWRPRLDRELIERLLPFRADQSSSETIENGHDAEDQAKEDLGSPKVWWLQPLNREDIRFFALQRGAQDVDLFLDAIERASLWSLAERPFDLDDLIGAWKDGRPFTSRLEVLREGIARRLQEIHPDRDERQPLALDRALDGARRLAAAILLSGEAGIRVPEGQFNRLGLDAEQALTGWDRKEVQALLARGIFNDAIYGIVRMRHREVRELLAAEWFAERLQSGRPRGPVEDLIFAERYGEQVIRPRLRPILPWLILLDDRVRDRALAIAPEIAVESGDAARLPLVVRRRILYEMVERIVRNEDDRSGRDNAAIARIAEPDLADDARALIERHLDNGDAIFFLGRLVWQGRMASCLAPLETIACDPARDTYARFASVRAVATLGGSDRRNALWARLNDLPGPLDRHLLAELVAEADADRASLKLVLASLPRLAPYEAYETTGLREALHDWIDKFDASRAQDAELLAYFVEQLASNLAERPHIEAEGCGVSEEHAWLMPVALHAIELLVQARSDCVFAAAAMWVLVQAPVLQAWGVGGRDERRSNVSALVRSWPDLNDALFWASVKAKREELAGRGEALQDDWPVSWDSPFWELAIDAFPRVISWSESRDQLDDRRIALSRALRILKWEDNRPELLLQIEKAVAGDVDLKEELARAIDPAPDPALEARLRRQAQLESNRITQTQIAEAERRDFETRLRAAPDLVRNAPENEIGEISIEQARLLALVQESSGRRSIAAGWQCLISSFGDAVANAWREAAISFWRKYDVPLASQGQKVGFASRRRAFALAGMAMEAEVDPNLDFLQNDELARRAFRHLARGLVVAPDLFERFYRARPDIGCAAAWAQVKWELRTTSLDTQGVGFLQDVVNRAPWLHADLADLIYGWLEKQDASVRANLRGALRLLKTGGTPSARLASLAEQNFAGDVPDGRDQTGTLFGSTRTRVQAPMLSGLR